MSFNLTDRGIKLLYRQRGSHLRRIDGDIDTLIIEDQTQSPTPEVEDEVPIVPEPGIPLELELGPDPGPGPEPGSEPKPEFEPEPELNFPQDGFSQNEVQSPPIHPPSIPEPREETLSIPVYNFQDIPTRQLSSSITSITSIESIKTVLTNLLDKEIIPHAKLRFQSEKNRESKMMHKLDIKIFQMVSQQLNNDFQDILDINISNNELLYQLRQLIVTREDLNQQLVQSRSELQHLKYGGEWYQLRNSHEKLQSRLRLNQELNQLTKTIESDDLPPSKARSLKKYDINDLCELLNPHTGLLNRLQNK